MALTLAPAPKPQTARKRAGVVYPISLKRASCSSNSTAKSGLAPIQEHGLSDLCRPFPARTTSPAYQIIRRSSHQNLIQRLSSRTQGTKFRSSGPKGLCTASWGLRPLGASILRRCGIGVYDNETVVPATFKRVHSSPDSGSSTPQALSHPQDFLRGEERGPPVCFGGP